MLDMTENRIKDEMRGPLNSNDSFTVNEKQSFKTSFDCTKAVSKIEKTICEVKELADADLEMGAIYRSLMSITPEAGKNQLKRNQLDWLQTRNKSCENSTNIVNCMQDSYIKRIEILKNKKPLKAQQPDNISGRYERENGNESAELTVALLPNGQVHVTGLSLWGTNRKYGPNIGNLDFEADIKDGRVIFFDHVQARTEEVYKLELIFDKDRLTAKEQNASGYFGMNVTFEGAYVKKIEGLLSGQ